MGVPSQKPMMKLFPSVAIFAFVLKACSASERCKDIRVPEGKCATLFDEEDCTGWSAEVSTGYSELSYRERNEAESVIVKPGCKFEGYDRADKNIPANRGDSITIDATKNDTQIWKNLKGQDNLEEEISSMVCNCNQFLSPLALPLGVGPSGPSRPRPFLPTDNVPRVPTKFGAQISTEKVRATTKTTPTTTTPVTPPTSQCSSVFNWSDNQCATLYQDQNCIGWGLDLAVGYTELTKINRHNDAELVIIRPGCKFVGYEYAHWDPELRGRSVTFSAANPHEHSHDVHHHNGEDCNDTPAVKKLRDSQLRNRIDSVECSCIDF